LACFEDWKKRCHECILLGGDKGDEIEELEDYSSSFKIHYPLTLKKLYFLPSRSLSNTTEKF